MAAKRPRASTFGKRKTRQTGKETSTVDTTQPPSRERRLVDVDPWAMLLEQLMEVPEESTPAKLEDGKRK